MHVGIIIFTRKKSRNSASGGTFLCMILDREKQYETT
jgi:hypothetical protein